MQEKKINKNLDTIDAELEEEKENNQRKENEIASLEKTIIKFEDVSKIYKGDFVALENINLEIFQKEFVSLVGHSGAGKSTLLKLIYAEEAPTEGIVYFESNPLNEISRRKLSQHRRKIGTIFQDFKLLPQKTIFENVAYALEVCGAPSVEIMEDVPQILDIVGLGDKMEKFPHQLSGGEQQKVVLARALIHKPSIILADEPTGNLDPESSMELVELLLMINKLGTTVVLATHDQAIVDKANRRVIVIEEGKIVQDTAQSKYETN